MRQIELYQQGIDIDYKLMRSFSFDYYSSLVKSSFLFQ